MASRTIPNELLSERAIEEYARKTERIAALTDLLKLLGESKSTETLSPVGLLRKSALEQIKDILNPYEIPLA